MKVTKNCIHIEDSYKINEIGEELAKIQKDYPECEVFKRKPGSLVREWRAHNRLYRLGLFRKHTKDVDLEYPINKAKEFVFWLIGI